MRVRAAILTMVAVFFSYGGLRSDAADSGAGEMQLRLSDSLLELLRSEMREVTGGVQTLPLAIAAADWKAIETTSARIAASYIMAQRLTAAQKRELESLPEAFQHLDANFHRRAEKLGAAAAARDAEQVVFHYSRLLESCASCHSQFAARRFPGFTPEATGDHHH